MKPLTEIEIETGEKVNKKVVLAVGASVLPFVNTNVWKQTWDFAYRLNLRLLRELLIAVFKKETKKL